MLDPPVVTASPNNNGIQRFIRKARGQIEKPTDSDTLVIKSRYTAPYMQVVDERSIMLLFPNMKAAIDGIQMLSGLTWRRRN